MHIQMENKQALESGGAAITYSMIPVPMHKAIMYVAGKVRSFASLCFFTCEAISRLCRLRVKLPMTVFATTNVTAKKTEKNTYYFNVHAHPQCQNVFHHDWE